MQEILSSLTELYFWTRESISSEIISSVIFLIIAIPVLFTLRRWARKIFTKNYTEHYGMLASKIVQYVGITLIIITILHQMNISLGPILGAAGIIGVALGFASQTSISNVISGFFLIAEQPFEVGDVVTINGITGAVLSIDTLSVKIRMFNNHYVRIPNQSVLNSVTTTITKFPIRRLDCNISVAYKENLEKVRDILFDVAEKNEISLSEPEPLLIFDKFGESGIDILFVLWCPKADFLKLRNSFHFEVKKRFDEEGIEIPFPHRSIYAGDASKPLPIKMYK